MTTVLHDTEEQRSVDRLHCITYREGNRFPKNSIMTKIGYGELGTKTVEECCTRFEDRRRLTNSVVDWTEKDFLHIASSDEFYNYSKTFIREYLSFEHLLTSPQNRFLL